MYYIAQTTKSAAEAARDREAAVQKHKFGVLHVHDLMDTLTRKGYPLGVTTIGTILPTELLRQLSPDPELAEVAATLEATIKGIIDDAAANATASRDST
jgi:hypothetical protein